MRWPWKQKLAEQKQAVHDSEARRQAAEQNWDFIREQVKEARRHRRQNHIKQLIIGVARGTK